MFALGVIGTDYGLYVYGIYIILHHVFWASYSLIYLILYLIYIYISYKDKPH